MNNFSECARMRLMITLIKNDLNEKIDSAVQGLRGDVKAISDRVDELAGGHSIWDFGNPELTISGHDVTVHVDTPTKRVMVSQLNPRDLSISQAEELARALLSAAANAKKAMEAEGNDGEP